MLCTPRHAVALMLFSTLASLSACATPTEEVDHFQYAATSAVRDFNIAVRPIPGQMQALQNPYGTAPWQGCAGLHREAVELQSSIHVNEGRRVGFRRDSGTLAGRVGNLRDTGIGAAASIFLPYRGVVRQVSGSAAYEQEAIEADRRARTRLGFLVGQGRAYRCPGFENPIHPHQ